MGTWEMVTAYLGGGGGGKKTQNLGGKMGKNKGKIKVGKPK